MKTFVYFDYKTAAANLNINNAIQATSKGIRKVKGQENVALTRPYGPQKILGGAVDFVQILALTHEFGQILKFIIFYP